MRYPKHYHRALNAVVAGDMFARKFVAFSLRQYRKTGQREVAKSFLSHVIWVGYPGKH